MTATMMEPRFRPDTPPPPNRLNRNPPTRAPAIPIRMVTMIPPGSRPGMITFANTPAISPRTIHEIMPIR